MKADDKPPVYSGSGDYFSGSGDLISGSGDFSGSGSGSGYWSGMFEIDVSCKTMMALFHTHL